MSFRLPHSQMSLPLRSLSSRTVAAGSRVTVAAGKSPHGASSSFDEATNEGGWVDRVVGLNDVRSDIAMMRTPDGHGRVELAKFHTPPAVRAEPETTPANALGIRRIMFAVDDIDDTVARLRSHGGELVDEIVEFEDIYRLCFMRGPEGFIVGLAEQLG